MLFFQFDNQVELTTKSEADEMAVVAATLQPTQDETVTENVKQVEVEQQQQPKEANDDADKPKPNADDEGMVGSILRVLSTTPTVPMIENVTKINLFE